ncbi:MAG TPA: alpha/beta fold hydrolase [Gemmatimonadaceae bacterium]|nr:alpha/beta fold hydrolase [Gemmatimonadaceae bacterium]
MAARDDTIYRFGEFELDTRLHELRRAGERRHVEPQVFDVLSHLFACRDRLVTKEELLDKVWGHRYVAPTTLNSRIKHARQAVGDDGDAQRVIRTVHGLGFRIVTDVEEIASPLAPQTSAAPEAGVPAEQRIQFCTAPDGARIAYATSGTGPLLVKPANWITHLEYDWESPVWRHWLRELSREHTLVRLDQRGSGLSDRMTEDLSFEAWVSDLETVVDTLGIERFPLVGVSQGCATAIAYAVRHPERVTRLVLYGGLVDGVLAGNHTQAEVDEAMLVLRGVPLGWGHDNPAFRMYFATRFLPEGTLEQMRWFSDLQRITTSAETGGRLLWTVATIDITALVSRVRVPTLVLHATGDAVIPFDQGRKMAALIPGSRFVPLESPNHILLEHEPAWARFTSEVRRFLAEETHVARPHTPANAALKSAAAARQRRSARRPRGRSG